MGSNGRRVVTLEEFTEGLRAIPNFRREEVWRHITSCVVDPGSLRPYVFFNAAAYTRNLIYKNEDFELLSICWEIGQASRIHNHRNQRCWMLLPQGRLRCQNYAVHDQNEEKQTCRLEPTRHFLLSAETPAQIEAAEPVHQMLNLREFNQRAVSLHIYSKPFKTCEVYQPDKGAYCDLELKYTSVFGKLCEGESAARP